MTLGADTTNLLLLAGVLGWVGLAAGMVGDAWVAGGLIGWASWAGWVGCAPCPIGAGGKGGAPVWLLGGRGPAHALSSSPTAINPVTCDFVHCQMGFGNGLF